MWKRNATFILFVFIKYYINKKQTKQLDWIHYPYPPIPPSSTKHVHSFSYLVFVSSENLTFAKDTLNIVHL